MIIIHTQFAWRETIFFLSNFSAENEDHIWAVAILSIALGSPVLSKSK